MSRLETKFTQVGTTVRSITFSSSNTTDSLVPKVIPVMSRYDGKLLFGNS